MADAKSWGDIQSRMKAMVFNEHFDLIVAIANGGIIPAAMLSQRLQLPVELLRINYRDSKQNPIYSSPQLLSEISFDVKNKKVLLVEDRVKTGATVNYARELLKDAGSVKTFAVNGNADYALYNEACFSFPWIL